MLSVLFVGNDNDVAASLADSVTLQQAGDAASARQCLDAPGAEFDAVLIDAGSQPTQGSALCASFRSSGLEVPILLLSEVDGADDVVLALNSGANDYLVRPFGLPELQARLRAHHRVYASAGTAVRTIGPYAFRPSARVLLERSRNRTIRLTTKEAAVLKYLHAANGRPVAKQTLLMEVWGYNDAVNSHTLETHIWRLRQKIEPNPSNARLLLSDRQGYSLNQAA